MRLLLHSGSCCVCEHPGWFQRKAQMQLQMTSWIYSLKITSDFYAEELQIKMLSQPKGIQSFFMTWRNQSHHRQCWSACVDATNTEMLDLLSFTVFSWNREGAYTRTALTSQTCSNCIFSVLSLNSFKFFKVNDNNDENALLGWPCWSCGIALLESDLCCFRDNFSFTWNWVKITFLSTGMPAHSFCGLTSNCVTQSKEG